MVKESEENIHNKRTSRSDINKEASHTNKGSRSNVMKSWETIVMDNMPEIVAYQNNNHNILWANKAAGRSVGKRADELTGKKCYQIWFQRNAPCPGCPVEKCIQTGVQEQGQVSAPGKRIWAIKANPVKNRLGKVVGAVKVIQDITELKQAEKARERSEQRYRYLFDNNLMGICIVETSGRIIEANEAMCRITGYSKQELLKINVSELYSEPAERSRLLETINKEGGFNDIEVKLKDKKGQTYWVSASSRPDKLEGREVLLATLLDINKRKKAEEELRQSELRYRRFFKTSRDCVFITSREGRWLDMNDLAPQFFGYESKEQLAKVKISELYQNPEERKAHIQTIAENGFTKDYPVNLRKKDCSIINTLITTVAVRDKRGKTVAFQGTIRDITAQKRAEQELLEKQARLKSLASQLTLTEERERRRLAGLLHDTIGQALVLAKLRLDALYHSVSEKSVKDELDGVRDSLGQSIKDMKSLTYDLSFPILYELGFETAVATWLSEQIGEYYAIQTEFEDDEQPKPLTQDISVLLFRSVRELLFNVIEHANAGKVKVSIGRIEEKIRVSVEDNGVGFGPDTEVAGKGGKAVGFGLFSIGERLEEIGGDFNIESEPGCGTRITITAPLNILRKGGSYEDSFS